ncbi:hypothetical protein Desmu_0540 [Desulfurococcus mucosus DSM 2162]|uniref:Uncharacterized protein n=1 Tax=Desulfurococcus mucosus (strain ATCC 35584 / DSM 2162 / JCM 9187 / O7/1) TaxID=765177 RepID=E8R8M4_DESM0|nr:hypothetical protein [Desulfurococcus mucosus]ADV64850.1 hypothetical protein Desmu_0540 [Desulfurococcus mucosus DSM 2162]
MSIDELLTQAKGDRSLVEKILSVFPGYKGYKDKEVLRETDRIVREKLYTLLKDASGELRALFREITGAQGYSTLAGEVERLLYRCDALAERVRHAPYGYKPFFNVVRINSDDLYRLLQYDASLAAGAVSLRNTVANARRTLASIGVGGLDVKSIEEAIRVLEAKLDERNLALMKAVEVA